MDGKTRRILVIDDEVYVRDSIIGFLEDCDYDVIEAENGRDGMEKLEAHQPDLVLCDLRMPEMDGLEVLARIAEKNRDIPVIIVSGAGNIGDTVEALRLGAWDYIIKPIQDMSVLDIAVNRAFERKRLLQEKETYQRDLEKANRELNLSLETLEQTRDKLVQAEKMAALGELVAGVAHEINTPVGVGVTAASFLDVKTREFTRLYESGRLKRSELEEFLKVVGEVSSSILINMERAAQLISGFKQVAVDQSSENRRAFNLKDYINDTLLSLGPRYKKTGHSIRVDCDPSIELNSYPGAFSQILNNLVMNSLTHGFKDMDRGRVDIRVTSRNGHVVFVYRDNGAGMDARQKEKVFDPFFTTMRGKGGTGLGMSIVFNLVTQTLGGGIVLESEPGQGVCITMTFPELIPEDD